jgi:hypothetical protein
MKVFQLILLLSLIGCAEAEIKSNTPLPKPSPNDEAVSPSYKEIKERIDSTRKSFRKEYLKANKSMQEKIADRARLYLLKSINDDLYSYWKGTPWDFNGITSAPNKGNIACGYFVTGLLQDCGYKLNRIKLSTCASMIMMKELTSFKDIKNLSSLSYEEFENWVKDYGEGLFIVGLDFHTGFIANDGKDRWFIHSNYINNIGVIKEKVAESAALKSSKTRYITCLTDNEKFLRSWLLN